MNWQSAIERNRQPLLHIVLALIALVGVGEGGVIGRLSQSRYRGILRILRPAEWAVRRLIVLAAHGLVVKPSPVRPANKLKRKGSGRKRSGRVAFPLFDPRVPFELNDEVLGLSAESASQAPMAPRRPPVAPAPALDGSVSAKALARRLAAIKAALEDLPSQARRLARWRARPLEQRKPMQASSLRPGSPPKFRMVPRHEVHGILRDCHLLVWDLPKPRPDTS